MKAGIFPAKSRYDYARLFDSLEAAFRMNIVGVDSQESDMGSFSALFLFAENQHLVDLAEKLGIPSFRVSSDPGAGTSGSPAVPIRFGTGHHVDPVMRGRVLVETWSPPTGGIGEKPGEEISAWCGDTPIWVTRTINGTVHYRVSVQPAELSADEVIWNTMRRGRFIRTFLLVHFLKKAVENGAWTAPPLRAAFIVDDPNTRGASYGYINYEKLVEHAKSYNYHAIMATVPLDLPNMNAGTCRLFTAFPERISLTAHGVLHAKHELARPFSMEEAERYLAHGVRLMDGFERKNRVPIARIMIAPHEKISLITTRAMVTSGFEGICINGKPYPYSSNPDTGDLLAGWNIATVIDGGLPVFLRDKITSVSNDNGTGVYQDQILKAFLGQPLLLYGHHEDFKHGFDILGQVAGFINSLGEVRWGSLDSVILSSFLHSTNGNLMTVRMYSRRIGLTVPDGIRHVRIQEPSSDKGGEELIIFVTGKSASMSELSQGEIFNVSPGELLSVTLLHPDTIHPADRDPLRRIAFSLMRRRLCELRDNARTLVKV